MICFACLTWLYGLFVRTLISLTNAYTDYSRPTLNFIERFRLRSVRSVCKWDMTKLNSKLTQMNCITMHKCTEMYSKPEIQNLDELKPEPERSSWRRYEKVNHSCVLAHLNFEFLHPLPPWGIWGGRGESGLSWQTNLHRPWERRTAHYYEQRKER